MWFKLCIGIQIGNWWSVKWNDLQRIKKFEGVLNCQDILDTLIPAIKENM